MTNCDRSNRMGSEPDRIDEIFQAAMDCAPEERGAFVETACANDTDLYQAVRRLLVAHEEAEMHGFIESPVHRLARHLIVNADRLSPEQSIGKYKIVKFLGAGGMGDVYLAQDTHLNRLVALKVLSTRLTTDDDRVRRFHQEALAASALNHPNIITIHEMGEWQDRNLIATEYVEGVTLRALIGARKLSLAEALDIALQIAAALAAAHVAGIVHRDIKPENIMLRPDGLVKVLDFGIAKYMKWDRGLDTTKVETGTGVIIGTTAYMSPEQARGQLVDARSDIWSLSVVLYEIIARRLPFTGATPTDLLASILEREPEPLSNHRRGTPAELDKLVQRGLTKDKDKRHASAVDFAEDLRRLRAKLSEERPFQFTWPALMRNPSGFSRKRAPAVLVSLLLVIAAVAVGLSYFRSEAAIDSLAVLRFVNASDSPDMEYLSDGISENLINSLSQLPQLKVTARSSSFRYNGAEEDMEAIARALGVRAIVMGKVVHRGDNLQVSVELVDVQERRQLWGEQYNRKLSDTQMVQREIARAITQSLRLRLTGTQGQQLTNTHQTVSDEAYQNYLKGRFHWNRRTGDSIRKAIEYFNQAIEKDPNYALAYAGLADSYVVPANPEPPGVKMPKAKAAAMHALELDETLSEAHTTLARVLTLYDWDWAGAEKEFKRAIELNPQYAVAHQWYGGYLVAMGRHDGSLVERRLALELDPLSVIINFELLQAFYHARDYDHAIEQGKKTLELDPSFPPVYAYLPAAYEQKGMFTEAIAGYKKGQTLKGGTEWSLALAGLGHLYAKSGRKEEARAILKELMQISRQDYVPSDSMALVCAGLGEKDKAFEWLERAYDERSFRMAWLKVEPRWDSLRSDPRFTRLLQRTGLSL